MWPLASGRPRLWRIDGLVGETERARAALGRGDAVLALCIGEALARVAAEDADVRAQMADGHRYLLDHGGDVSFWEHGWLRTQLARWSPSGVE